MTTLTRPLAARVLAACVPAACILAGAALLTACSSSGDDDGGDGSLPIVNSAFGILGDAPVAIQERYIIFLADEMTTGTLPGSDLNGDGDSVDQIAVVANVATRVEASLGVAAQQVFTAAGQFYVVVDEAEDGRNWESPSDLDTSVVLLHWSEAAGMLTYVDTLADTNLAQADDRLFYSSATLGTGALTTPTLPGESSTYVVDAAAAPLLPVAVVTSDPFEPLQPTILGADEGLVYLALDETLEARDLNDDADTSDSFVLALLDGLQSGAVIRNTRLAVASATPPFRALNTGTGDWLVGFLVSEAAQGGVSLNDANDFDMDWQPSQCGATVDTDALDDVLHVLGFAGWETDPMGNPIRNTGLAGSRRVVAVPQYVGTISPEADASCDLNNDGDLSDDIFRWTALVVGSPILPEVREELLRAVFDVPGGTGGAAELRSRWVIVVDEAAEGEDIDGDGMMDANLVGWFNPASTQLDFTFTPFVGVSWMQEEVTRSLLPMGFLEEYTFVTNNDGDVTDTFPTWTRFNDTSSVLIYPGVARAVVPTNVGLVVANSITMFRVSEADDSRDWNGDGDTTDLVLLRSGVSPTFVSYVGDSTDDVRPVVEVDPFQTVVAAFLSDEAARGVDLNGDGDTTDIVLRYFRI